MNTIEICGAKLKMKQIVRDVNSNLSSLQYSHGKSDFFNQNNNTNYKSNGTL